ncbi:MAG: transcriptional repressor [Actinobacteria bacterium]|nr:transcriptional repressor [Actinomycetota bacterium]
MNAREIEPVLELLRSQGHRVTPQRRAIVAEIMGARGHMSATDLATSVGERVPGVNPSTIYRTLAVLEEAGVVSHAHFEGGPEYHRLAESDHVHLVCSRCGSNVALPLQEVEPLSRILSRASDFQPDFTHFAISGVCSKCARRRSRKRRT